MAYTYPARMAGSNFEPIALEVRKEGVLLPTLGVLVTVYVKDQATGEVIVDNASAVTTEGVDGLFQYYFSLRQISCVCRTTTWLIQWTIAIGNYRYVSEQATLIVRKPL